MGQRWNLEEGEAQFVPKEGRNRLEVREVWA